MLVGGDVPDSSPNPHSEFEFDYDKDSPSHGNSPSHKHIRFADVEDKTESLEKPSRLSMKRVSQYPYEDEEEKRERLEQMRKNYIRRQSTRFISNTDGRLLLIGEDS